MQKKVQTEKEETTPPPPTTDSRARQERREIPIQLVIWPIQPLPSSLCFFFYRHYFDSFILFKRRSTLPLFWLWVLLFFFYYCRLINSGFYSLIFNCNIVVFVQCAGFQRHFHAFAFVLWTVFLLRWSDYSTHTGEQQLDLLNSFNNNQLQWNISMKIFLRGNKELFINYEWKVKVSCYFFNSSFQSIIVCVIVSMLILAITLQWLLDSALTLLKTNSRSTLYPSPSCTLIHSHPAHYW